MFYVLITQLIANEQNFPVVLFISDGSNITLCVSLPFQILCNLCNPQLIYWSTYQLISRWYIGRYIGRVLADMSTDISTEGCTNYTRSNPLLKNNFTWYYLSANFHNVKCHNFLKVWLEAPYFYLPFNARDLIFIKKHFVMESAPLFGILF